MLVPTSASGLEVHIRAGALASTEPTVFAPSADAARANGQRLAAPTSQRVTGTLARRDVVAVPTLTAFAKPTSTPVGSNVTDTVTVTGLGSSSTSVHVQLWGPFPTPAEIACTGSPLWSGSFVATGDTTAATAPVPLQRGGYYGYVASIPVQAGVVGTATQCGASSQTVAAVAHPALTTSATAAVVRRGASISDRIAVRGLGRTPATVEAALYGPFASRVAIRCDTPHRVWRGTVAVAGDGEARTASVKLERPGFYGYREQVAAATSIVPTATPCAPAEETALVAPAIVTGRGDVATFAAGRGGGPLRPARIRVASLGIDAPVGAAGIDVRHGVLGIPSDIHRVGWWRDGAVPGDATGTILIAGHVDSAAGGVGAFFPLRKARAGDRIELATAGGRSFVYRVVSVRLYAKAALPPTVYATGGKARLVLVTCGGPFDAASGHYLDDLVVTAVAGD